MNKSKVIALQQLHGAGTVGHSLAIPGTFLAPRKAWNQPKFWREVSLVYGDVITVYLFLSIPWAHPALARVDWITPPGGGKIPRHPCPRGAVMKFGQDHIKLADLPHFKECDAPAFVPPQFITISLPVGGFLL